MALCSVPETHCDRTDQRIFHILISRQVILTSVNLNFMLIACLCPFSCGGKSPVPPTCVFLPSVSLYPHGDHITSETPGPQYVVVSPHTRQFSETPSGFPILETGV